MKTSEKLDKDRFRQSLGGEAEAYQEVARRLGLLPEEGEENPGARPRQPPQEARQVAVSAAPRPRRHPQRRARPARLSRPRRHGGRAGQRGRRPAWARASWSAWRGRPTALPTEEVGDNRLRPLAGLVDVPPIPAPLRRLAEWTADYYLSPARRGAADGAAVLLGARRAAARWSNIARPALAPDRLTPQREKALAAIEGRQGTVRELAAPCRGQRRGDARAGQRRRARAGRGRRRPALPRARPRLRAAHAQRRASRRRRQPHRRDRPAASIPVLLDGVTGSGKTEVYFEAIAEALRQGRQVLVLLPEIALTEPFLTRFTARFGCEPVAWHSRPALVPAPPRLARDRQRARPRSWSARARRCSCPTPSSA